MTLATIETEAGTMAISLENRVLVGRTEDGLEHEIGDQRDGGYDSVPDAIEDIRSWYGLKTWGLVELVDWREHA